MPRHARSLASVDIAYHIIARGNNKNVVFHDDEDFRAYLNILMKAKERFGFELFHFVLMHNHVHLLMRPKAPGDLSETMKFINQTYSLHTKKRYGHIGHIWQDRFKNYPVDNDAYLLTAGIYIELNPVRAGVCTHPNSYPYSSHKTYEHDVPSELVTLSPAYLALSASREMRITTYASLTRMWIALKSHKPEQMQSRRKTPAKSEVRPFRGLKGQSL